MKKTTAACAVSVLTLAFGLVSTSPASATSIKKDDNCITVITPTVQYGSGDPEISDPEVYVHNCVTVEPD